ncbi:peptidoglycan/xylan/chitin deacetylase (PgdA/CDA1 family) [Flavobacterium sp. 28YEA47A]|uniref:polysaccharide deacetylase family protein n=1 Tax=Flavobacterium sp. 28YEA47A TaxID=3156276 RepID=UPI00351389EF
MKLSIRRIGILFYILFSIQLYAQKQVAITIDDVPNTWRFQKDGFQSLLLKKLDSLQLPIAIFINEQKIYEVDSVIKNFRLLDDWVKRKYITLGNHTFKHSSYSDVGFTDFTNDIDKGEAITWELAKRYGKPLKYFRFPYNNLGKDSLQHKEIEQYLTKKAYRIAPFTVESEDWVFGDVYEYYLAKNDIANARSIGEKYVKKTIEFFEFFETQATQQYKRSISQIYLCHDNALNAEYLPKIVKLLKAKGYSFVSLDEALQDPMYQLKDNYYKSWGVSWFYRLMKSQTEAAAIMQKEPNNDEIEKRYNDITKD